MISVEALKGAHERVVNALCGNKVVFHHVPKCGGTSVGRAIRLRYLPSQVTVLPEASYRALELVEGSHQGRDFPTKLHHFREQAFAYHMICGVRCVSAHVPFSEAVFDRFHNEYNFITILREPVSRYISHYFFSYGRKAHAGISESLPEFIETDRGAQHGAMFVYYFSGLEPSHDMRSAEAIERARNNLRKFDVVGLLEDLPRFQERLGDVLDIRVKIGHENKGRADGSTKRTIITPELRRRIEELCCPDIEIYELARSLASRPA
jgi:hypothetical protein